MNYNKWVKSIQTAGYNGACTVVELINNYSQSNLYNNQTIRATQKILWSHCGMHATYLMKTHFPSDFNFSQMTRQLLTLWSLCIQTKVKWQQLSINGRVLCRGQKSKEGKKVSPKLMFRSIVEFSILQFHFFKKYLGKN